jgi:pyroglutamyl-peptidase
MRGQRMLITGFGPFPGVTENPSAWLAKTLAAHLSARAKAVDVRAAVFPTEWEHVRDHAPPLLERLSPDIVLQFGVSRRAQGFVVERSAHNTCMDRDDATGSRPSKACIVTGGAARQDTAMPVSSLVDHLRRSGVPATPSANAGRYLCNQLYYLSLDWAARRAPAPLVGFVHIPLAWRQGGRLNETELLAGATAIADFALGFDRRLRTN